MVGSAAQKASGFQRFENRLARGAVEIPQSLCLSSREPESRHLAVFRSNESQKISHIRSKRRHRQVGRNCLSVQEQSVFQLERTAHLSTEARRSRNKYLGAERASSFRPAQAGKIPRGHEKSAVARGAARNENFWILRASRRSGAEQTGPRERRRWGIRRSEAPRSSTRCGGLAGSEWRACRS